MQRLVKAAQSRKLDRVAAVYAVAGWILVQGASIVLPTFNAPVWALRVFIMAVVAGFPVALAAAWTVAPHPNLSILERQTQTSRADNALIALLAAVVFLSVAQIGYEFWVAPIRPSTGSQGPGHSPTSFVPDDASIAVLPFENLSSDKDTGYFAAGIQDEILSRLSKIRSLKVISRTSTAQYDSRPGNLREIGRQLGAATILEGSVQKVGDVVRINVQLIRAASDVHVWAEIYDRKLDDVFGVESDVAAAIATALAAQVTPLERVAISAKLTNNPRAYDSYLRALVLSRRNDDPSLKQAIANLEDAVRIDPKFATAWALLSRVYAYEYFGTESIETDRTAASTALIQALALAPQSPEVKLAQGFCTYYVERNYTSAFRQFHEVYAKWPNNSDVLYSMAVISRRLAQWHASSAYFRQAVVLSPRDFRLRQGLGTVLFLRRAYSENLTVADEALRDFPDNLVPLTWKAGIFQAMGELDRADAMLRDLHPGATDDDAINAIATQLRYRHSYGQGVKFMTGLIGLAESQGIHGKELAGLVLQLAEFQRLSGDARAASESYGKVIGILTALLAPRPDNSELLSYLAYCYSGLKDRAKALATADRAVKSIPFSKDALEGAQWEANRALVLSRLGEREAAIADITMLLKVPSLLTPAMLRFDPDFDSLRGDRRFESLANSNVVEN